MRSEQVMVQFLANVSHELRTPLNAIINFSQFVSSGLYGPINEKQADVLDKSTDSARHLLAMINDILDMSKIEAGRMDLFVEKEVDLCPELEAVAAATATLLANKPVEFVKEIGAGLPAVVGDRRRIRQILLNLTLNAAKFTDQGHVCLRARRDGDHLLFEVEDTGPGITAEEQARVFRPFHQSRRGATSAAGTGLGLPNMAEIELSVLHRQCLKARIPDQLTLIDKVTAWEGRRNAAGSTVNWRFSTEDARIKLHKLYPTIDVG